MVKPLSAKDLKEDIEWEGGFVGMFDYTDSIRDYNVSDELKELYENAVKAYDKLVKAFEDEVG